VKFKIIMALLLMNPFMVMARGQEHKKNSIGGVEVDDPFKDINKQSASRADRKKAEDIMAQLGYGLGSKSTKKTEAENSRSAK
jgi:hypothetical protein